MIISGIYSKSFVEANMKVPSTREEWIRFLADAKAVPVWSDDVYGNVYFRRLKGPETEAERLTYGKHVLGKQTRIKVANILGIHTRADCVRVREEIKKKIRDG